MTQRINSNTSHETQIKHRNKTKTKFPFLFKNLNSQKKVFNVLPVNNLPKKKIL